MRTRPVRLFAVAALVIAASGCGFRPEVRHPLMRSPILVELPGVHPVQMVVDLDVSGNTVGAMAMFGPHEDIGQLAKALDASYGRWRVYIGYEYAWRVEDQLFVVTLHQEGDWIRMIYIPFIDAEHPPTALSAPCACETPPKSN